MLTGGLSDGLLDIDIRVQVLGKMVLKDSLGFEGRLCFVEGTNLCTVLETLMRFIGYLTLLLK